MCFACGACACGTECMTATGRHSQSVSQSVRCRCVLSLSAGVRTIDRRPAAILEADRVVLEFS